MNTPNGSELRNSGLKLFMRAQPRFQKWSDATLSQLQSAATPVYRPEGSLVQHAGGNATDIFILTHGVIETWTTLSTGEEHLLALLTEGSLLGLTSMFLPDEPLRRQNWVAHTSVVLWRVPIVVFKQCFNQDSGVAATVLQSMASRIQWLMDEVAATAILPAECKVIRCLLGFSLPPEPSGLSDQPGIKLTHAKLALMLGLTRQSVAQVLKKLEARNLILVERLKIEIISRSALLEYGFECGASRLEQKALRA